MKNYKGLLSACLIMVMMVLSFYFIEWLSDFKYSEIKINTSFISTPTIITLDPNARLQDFERIERNDECLIILRFKKVKEN